MKKITYQINKKSIYLLSLFTLFLYDTTYAQCPENITVNNDEGECGAVVTYSISGSGAVQSDNGIVNHDASNGLNGWNVTLNGGNGWTTADNRFRTSYANCAKNQLVDLSDLGLTDDYMDTQPAITVSDDYIGIGPNYSDIYFLTVELRGATGNVIASYTTGNITTSSEWQTASHTFTDYGAGVRSVYFSHGGRDVEFWAGQYGAAMTNAEVTVAIPTSTIVQTAGLESGEMFPVGTTTNTFEITDEDDNVTTCSFDVVVNDNEAPIVITNNYTAALDVTGSIIITGEDIDNGSSDNCEIISYELDIYEFSCEDLGENTVTLTVTDANGNTSSQSAIVTVVDNLGPTITVQDFTVALDDQGNAVVTADDIATVTDNCGTFTYEVNITEFNCDNLGNNTVIITATDEYGNTSTANAVLTVEDITAPIVVTQDITIALNESGVAVITVDDVNDGSTDNCGIFSYGLDTATFGCTHIGENEITLTVIDGFGNEGTGTVIVTVEDPNNYCALNTTDLSFDASVKIYPNPTDGILTIASSDKKIATGQLYDIGGRLIKEFIINSYDHSLNFSELNSGLYILKLYSENNTLVKQIVKN